MNVSYGQKKIKELAVSSRQTVHSPFHLEAVETAVGSVIEVHRSDRRGFRRSQRSLCERGKC